MTTLYFQQSLALNNLSVDSLLSFIFLFES